MPFDSALPAQNSGGAADEETANAAKAGDSRDAGTNAANAATLTRCLDWAGRVLRDSGCSEIQTPTAPRVRPWSTVVQLSSDRGQFFLKVCRDGFQYEPSLTAFLAKLSPDDLPAVVAHDDGLAALLLEDSGEPLRTPLKRTRDLSLWYPVLRRFAGLQFRTHVHTREFRAMGVPDRSPDLLPAMFAEMIADDRIDLEVAERRTLESRVDDFASNCAILAQSGVPESIHHDDFHDANVFLADGNPRITDWGEACVTFPFFTVLVVHRSVENSLDIPELDPALDVLRDAYLFEWRALLGSRFGIGELQELFAISRGVAMINRALTWRRSLDFMNDTDREEYRPAVSSWLRTFIES